jgi:hypothetical protein
MYTARKLKAARGQYLIMHLRVSRHFWVWHRRHSSKTGEEPERAIGKSDTLDSAKVRAQAHADQYDREKPTAA